MKRLLTTTALGLLIAAGPALAQTSQETPSPASPPAEQNQPDTGSPAAPSAPESSPGASGGQQPGADSSQPGATSPDTAQSSPDTAKSSDTAQSGASSPLTEETLASNLIGVAVENASGETIGEINDIVLAQDGSVKAALIGVGGFLGMGAKNVSVNFSELNIKRDDGNNLTVTVAMSSDSLEAMPAYQEKGTASSEAGGTETSGTDSTKTQERAPGTGTSPTPGTQ